MSVACTSCSARSNTQGARRHEQDHRSAVCGKTACTVGKGGLVAAGLLLQQGPVTKLYQCAICSWQQLWFLSLWSFGSVWKRARASPTARCRGGGQNPGHSREDVGGAAPSLSDESGSGVRDRAPVIPGPSAKRARSATVRVVVVDEVDKLPVKDIPVILRRASGTPVTFLGSTGDGGDVEFAAVPHGTYRLVEPKRTEAPIRELQGLGNASRTYDWKVEASPYHDKVIEVVDESGAPVGQAQLWVDSEVPVRIGCTDASGRASLRMQANSPGLTVRRLGFKVRRLVPSALGQRELSVSLERGGAAISGRLMGGGGLRGKSVQVTLLSLSSLPPKVVAVQSIPLGQVFEFVGLEAGDYRVIATVDSLAAATTEAACAERGLTACDLFVAPVEPLMGSVAGPDGRPIAGAFVTIYLGGHSAAECRTGEDGRFVVSGLPLAPLRVFAAIAGTDRCGSTDVVRSKACGKAVQVVVP